VDEVKRLLSEFADQAVADAEAADTLAADVDADVARGRRALRRIRARRGMAGVLCAAAVTTGVLAVGNQAEWWGGGGAGVATDSPADRTTPEASSSEAPVPGRTTEGPTVMYGAATVELVTNKQSWPGLGCALVPAGWSAAQPLAPERVVLAPPTIRSSASTGTADKLVLTVAPQAERLLAVRATEAGGKTIQLGNKADGQQVGQVRIGERWLVAQVPVGDTGWNDQVLQRFLASCTLPPG